MIKWQTAQIKISDLKEYDENPRTISTKEFNKLVKSLKEDGYHQRILVNLDNIIIGGHQRKKALLKAGFKEDDSIEVLQPNRMLSWGEMDKINIRDNLHFGEYDFEMLANKFNSYELIDIGMPQGWLIGFDELDVLNTTKVIIGKLYQFLCEEDPYEGSIYLACGRPSQMIQDDLTPEFMYLQLEPKILQGIVDKWEKATGKKIQEIH